jgi:TonB family protein
MHLEGTVRIEVTVAPNGSVKKTNVLGGNPVLVQAAERAVMTWKWEPRPEQTTETVQFNFHEN